MHDGARAAYGLCSRSVTPASIATMLTSYLKTALRFFRRQKGYATLNVVGLAVGLACAFFILLWVQDERRVDRFHDDVEQLYVVKRHMKFTNGDIVTAQSVTVPAAAELEAGFPEIEHAELVSFRREIVIAQGDHASREEGIWADSAFFDIFSFPLLAGDPATALAAPDGIVLSERLAEVFFPGERHDDVIGQTVRVDDRADFRVTGVAAEAPDYSTLQFDWVIPFAEFRARNAWVEHWGNSGNKIFIRLRDGADHRAVSAKIRTLIGDNFEDSTPTDLFLQPFGDQYLYNKFDNGQQVGGRIEYVRIFSVVALFLVLIACINFMNLATARAGQRAREIGVRKSLGASRGRLVGQFLSEAVLTAIGAFALAALTVTVLLPAFNEVAGKAVSLAALGAGTWALFFAIAIGAGLLAGSYPALVLSGFDPARVLRGGDAPQGGVGLRKFLVVAQFAASILLIVGTFVVSGQLDYIQSKNLGLDRDNVIAFNLEESARERFSTFQQSLRDRPGIEGVSAASSLPFSIGNSTTDPVWEGKDPDSETLFHALQTHYGFTETMRMELVAGRTFSPAFGADSVNFVVNETAARVMGMDAPVGEALSMWGRDGQIVGVVKDFHMASLYEPIEPTIILLEPEADNLWLVTARLSAGQTSEGLASVQEAFATFNPGVPFDYEFLDAQFGEMYESEQRIATLANVFAVVAAFIACLGLLGLAAYAAQRRRKEIGVRKVLGASVTNVVGLLSRDFLTLVLVACALTLPLAYLGAERWLSDFAFRADLGAGPFVLAGSAALVLAALTVGVQAYRAASADPVQSLRSE